MQTVIILYSELIIRGCEKEERRRERANERKKHGFGRVTELQKASRKSQVKNGRGLH